MLWYFLMCFSKFQCLRNSTCNTVGHLINVFNLKILVEPIIKTYTKIIDGRPVEVTEKKVTEERIIQGKL